MDNQLYVFVSLTISQIAIDYISEIASFASLEEAESFAVSHPEYQSSGHGWSGRTEYAILIKKSDHYTEIDGSPLVYPRNNMFAFERTENKGWIGSSDKKR